MAEIEVQTFSRDDIRTAVLDSKGDTELVSFRGVQIEIRSPALEDLVQYRNASEDDTVMARAIVQNCWVPGTQERVFDETDIPAIMKLKLNADMRRLNKTLTRILGADDLDEKVSDATKSD